MWRIGSETKNMYRILARKHSLGNNITIDLGEIIFENYSWLELVMADFVQLKSHVIKGNM
jgi:hypothetical protein